MTQRTDQFLRQGCRYELGQQLLVAQVRIDHVLQAVVVNEPVKILRCQHHGPRHQHTDAFPAVVQVVLLQHMVEERESSTLTAHRSVAASGEPYRVVIGLRAVFGHHA